MKSMKRLTKLFAALATLACAAALAVPSMAWAGDEPELPNAEVKNLGALTIDEYTVYSGSGIVAGSETPIHLQIAMEFEAKDTPEQAAANAYANYTTDFFISISGIGEEGLTLNGCYLAGNYDPFGWVMVPLDGMTVKNGEIHPVISSVGLDFKWLFGSLCG